jgi:hypothetical protein
MDSWPLPNYVNPKTRVNLLLGIEAPLTGITILFVGARFYSRTMVKRVLGWDDWVMVCLDILVLNDVR